MKRLTVSKSDFDTIVYPLVATTPPPDGSTSELMKVIKILELLEARSSPATDPGIDAAVGVPTLYELDDPEAVFRFEDDLAAILSKRIETGIKMLAPMRSRVIPGLMAQLTEDVPVDDPPQLPNGDES